MARKMFIVLAIATVALLTGPISVAQEWVPSGPVNNIAPFNPGGGTDLLARATQKYIDLGGQSMFVTNMVGANGVIGAMEVYGSKPDGRTMLCHNITSIIGSRINGTLEVDPLEFEALGSLVYDCSVIYVSADSPFKTISDIVDAAKKNPEQLKWGASALYGTNHLASALFFELAGISMNYVPFSGGSQHRAAVMGHHVDLGYGQISEIYPNIVSGEIRAVAVLGENRLPRLPDVPTLKESGYDLIDGAFRGYFVAPKTPKNIIDSYAILFKKITENPEFIKFVEEDLGSQVLFKSPEDIKTLAKEQFADRQRIYNHLKAKEK